MMQRKLLSVLLTTGLLSSPVTAQQVDEGGFAIRINGVDTSTGASRSRGAQSLDRALAEADIRIQYDGLEIEKRLNLAVIDAALETGVATVRAVLNYADFVTRAEVLLFDAKTGARLGKRAVQTNARTTINIPSDTQSYAVLRVYDEAGRFDETAPIVLGPESIAANAEWAEVYIQNAATDQIRVAGGAVTVSGSDLPSNTRLRVLSEEIETDPQGRFVLKRILPVGDHTVRVEVLDSARSVDVTRDVTVPASEWFYVGQAELTVATLDSARTGRRTETTGRVAGYITGRRANGMQITGQIDTGEGELRDIFRSIDEKDPRSTIARVDPDDLYPTYGDDSTIVDATPTSGKAYLRLEKDNDYLVWGDWRADLTGTTYLRNDRNLYGLRAHKESRDLTALGWPKFTFDAYAAQPDRTPQRDVFRATGGSLYFLQRQDIGAGTDTVLVQTRDAQTGRILETRRLVSGADYTINYVQGLLTLAQPLSGNSTSNGIVQTDAGSTNNVELVVQYEYTPTGADLDTFTYGARGTSWLTDNFRVGAAAVSEETGQGTQKLYGLDAEYRLSDQTFFTAEIARSEGPGFRSVSSIDGGFTFNGSTSQAGAGNAIRLEAQAALKDFSSSQSGDISAYFERRTKGFSTLDYTTASDETLWGFDVSASLSDRANVRIYYDDFADKTGVVDREGGLEVIYDLSATAVLDFGIKNLQRSGGSDDGSRTDAALRLTLNPMDDLSYYVLGQTTLERSGTLANNNRLAAGGAYSWADNWSVEAEVSDGDQGEGGRILLRHDKDGQGSVYAGFELDPSLSGSEFGSANVGDHQGKFILGGDRKVSENTTIFGENILDRFGKRRSLTSSYGVNYAPTDQLRYVGSFEIGTVRDDLNGDFDRRAASFAVSYADDALSGKARIEYREDDGIGASNTRDTQSLFLNTNAEYKLDEENRFVFSAELAETEGNNGLANNGDLIDVVLGYARRPIADDRFNVLLQYRFLKDTYGQQLDNSDDPGPVQRTHVFGIDAEYDVNPRWSVGAKLGMRKSESASDNSATYFSNDASLAVLNARWHMVNEWDALLELRTLNLIDAGVRETGALGAIYKHVNDTVKVGAGYNFGSFSDDLTDLTYDDRGAFINIIAKF